MTLFGKMVGDVLGGGEISVVARKVLADLDEFFIAGDDDDNGDADGIYADDRETPPISRNPGIASGVTLEELQLILDTSIRRYEVRPECVPPTAATAPTATASTLTTPVAANAVPPASSMDVMKGIPEPARSRLLELRELREHRHAQFTQRRPPSQHQQQKKPNSTDSLPRQCRNAVTHQSLLVTAPSVSSESSHAPHSSRSSHSSHSSHSSRSLASSPSSFSPVSATKSLRMSRDEEIRAKKERDSAATNIIPTSPRDRHSNSVSKHTASGQVPSVSAIASGHARGIASSTRMMRDQTTTTSGDGYIRSIRLVDKQCATEEVEQPVPRFVRGCGMLTSPQQSSSQRLREGDERAVTPALSDQAEATSIAWATKFPIAEPPRDGMATTSCDARSAQPHGSCFPAYGAACGANDQTEWPSHYFDHRCGQHHTNAGAFDGNRDGSMSAHSGGNDQQDVTNQQEQVGTENTSTLGDLPRTDLYQEQFVGDTTSCPGYEGFSRGIGITGENIPNSTDCAKLTRVYKTEQTRPEKFTAVSISDWELDLSNFNP